MKSTVKVTRTPPALTAKIVLPGLSCPYGNGTLPPESTGGSGKSTGTFDPLAVMVRFTAAPGGKPRATQSVVEPAWLSTQPLTPGGILGLGVGVHVGVGPARSVDVATGATVTAGVRVAGLWVITAVVAGGREAGAAAGVAVGVGTAVIGAVGAGIVAARAAVGAGLVLAAVVVISGVLRNALGGAPA